MPDPTQPRGKGAEPLKMTPIETMPARVGAQDETLKPTEEDRT